MTIDIRLLSGMFATALLLAAMPGHADDTPWQSSVLHAGRAAAMPKGRLTKAELDTLVKRGETLFGARFTTPDGAGRPRATQAIIPTKRKRPAAEAFQRLAGMDANACSSCHIVPLMGGAGDFSVNVFVSEGFTNADFDTSDPQFSNERNTNHMFGAALVELLAREMTVALQTQRRDALRKARSAGSPQKVALYAKGVAFGTLIAEPDGMVDLSGIDGVDTDLVIRPFSQKGVMTSLRQFTVNALNHHHGIEAVERFGVRWTGESDFDEDGVGDEIGAADVSALVAWQATLPPPHVMTPADQRWKAAAARGTALFNGIGCDVCHVPALPLSSLVFDDPGPNDAAGTLRRGEADDAQYDLALLDWADQLQRNDKGEVLVPLFGDLKRHKMADQQVAVFGNELLAQRFVERDVFQTTELWGIADTAPYGHRGDLTTLDEAIRAHGGDGRKARDAYIALPEGDRSALIAFLKTLVIK